MFQKCLALGCRFEDSEVLDKIRTYKCQSISNGKKVTISLLNCFLYCFVSDTTNDII